MTACKIGNKTYRSRSAAASWYLKRSKFSQSEIARKVGVTVPCVNQIAAKLKG